MSRFFGLLVVSLLCGPLLAQQSGRTNRVPDQETAIKVAEAIWLPIYGKSIYERTPFTAELKDGIWYVTGTLQPPYYEITATGDSILHLAKGGVPYIQIASTNCEVIDVGHSK